MFTRVVLKNGVRVLLEKIKGVRSVSIGVWVLTGTVDENDDEHGISHFIEHMMFKGTSRRNTREIAESIEAVGGQLNAYTCKEFTCYYAKVRDEHASLAVDVLSDMIMNSLFAPEEIEREKNVILEEIKLYEDSPDEIIHDIFMKVAWRNEPLGRQVLGTVKTVEAVSRESILNFMKRNYVPEKIMLSVAGNIRFSEIVRLADRTFGTLPPSSNFSFSEYKKPVFTPGTFIVPRKTEQVHVIMGSECVDERHPERYTLAILNSILGGSMSSRLFQEIREKRGLAYSIYSYPALYRNGGLFAIYAGVAEKEAETVVKTIKSEIDLLVKEGITRQELERTKEQLKGNLILSLESTSTRMNRLAKNEICFGKQIEIDEMLDEISAVTRSRVRKLAGSIFREGQMVLTALGPLENGKALAKITGVPLIAMPSGAPGPVKHGRK